MKLDTGLQEGIGALRDDDHLLDLTLKVEGQEFRVHKAVLASVSDYFRAMLCGSLLESRTDVIELKGIHAEQVSVLLDFIYTGDDDVIASNPKEMLECGLYFQVPKVIKECEQRLIASLCVENCLDLLSTFQKFPLGDTAQMIKVFIKTNMKKVINYYAPHEITIEILQMARKNWKNSEWELFNYLNLWIAVDFEVRKEYMNNFMNQVRFKLMTPEELRAVKESTMYKDTDSKWKGLVDDATEYHKLPIHMKVLDKSIQNTVRFSKSLFLMNTNQYQERVPKTYVSSKDKQGKNCWKRYSPAKPPQGTNRFQATIEINNFLITCSTTILSENQRWQIFDPRTLTWHDMATMPRPRDKFPIVYFNSHLYVLGGRNLGHQYPREYYDTVEEYSFETDAWNLINKLPLHVAGLNACVINGAIYVCGGQGYAPIHQKLRMDCLDLATQKWESKASMLKHGLSLKMCVMKIRMKDVIVIIYHDQEMAYYDPDTDQWSHFNFSVSRSLPFMDRGRPLDVWCLDVYGSYVIQGNTVFMTDVSINRRLHRVCLKWTIPEEENKFDIVEVRLGNVPFKKYTMRDFVIASTLAFPAQSVAKDT